jgi:hypothetical protein
MSDEMPVLDLRGWINGAGDGHSSPVRGDHDLAGIGQLEQALAILKHTQVHR